VSPVRLDRSRRDPDIWLGQKMLFFVTGAAVGVAGMIIDRPWVIWLAIGILAVGLLLRIQARMAARRDAAAADADEVEPDDAEPEDFDTDPPDDEAARFP
jgi:hypothetical protein